MEIPRYPDVLIDVDSDISDTNPVFVALVHSIMVNCCKIWKFSVSSDLVLHRLTTANSNFVYTVRNSMKGADPEMTILRIYGKLNVMFDRADEERTTVALAEMGIIQPLYAVFGNGRVEPYIQHTPVSSLMFRDASTAHKIAEKMKTIHSFISVLSAASSEKPMDKMWERLDTLRRNAAAAQVTMLGRTLEKEGHADMFSEMVSWDLFQESTAVQRKAIDSNSPIVFGHCDIHHGNVLNTDAGLLIIDYEYSLPTARGFDFANFFCEFCSDYDVEGGHEVSFDLYPSPKERLGIFRAYLGPDATDEELLRLENETACYLPFVHLQWAHWGLIKAQETHLSSYDHLRYAYLRYKEWKKLTASFAEVVA